MGVCAAGWVCGCVGGCVGYDTRRILNISWSNEPQERSSFEQVSGWVCGWVSGWVGGLVSGVGGRDRISVMTYDTRFGGTLVVVLSRVDFEQIFHFPKKTEQL